MTLPENARRISVLGATGSVGQSTFDIIADQLARHGEDSLHMVAFVAKRNVAALAELALRFRPEFVAIADERFSEDLRDALAGTGIAHGAGQGAVEEAAAREADWTMAAIVGAAGLRSTLQVANRGGAIAIANKESLVCAGALLMRTCARTGAQVLPVDSEHNAIFQVLDPERRSALVRIVLTASGGPFRTWTLEQMKTATPEQAIAHPIWSMGAKISVDSASLMNKGLELIEACHLFDVSSGEIDVLIHPQSVVHGLVEYADGSILAQLGPADMRVPIASAFAWPERIATRCERLDLARVSRLDFETPDTDRFPALNLARNAMKAGDVACTALNAANEVAVEAFLAGQIGFLDISALVADVLEGGHPDGGDWEGAPEDYESVFALDHLARTRAQALLAQKYN
ncbi:MAG: 1-deoxy-D-xylulose-5-phosphate reductoisomerase [Robiginitomaculum sp.]|nr:1-deoxy-D-xylulose-5-phosphate reductoisomerase [Robiginitomaculum sp.]MDQ7078480.1 1-deoxy-D-xylulose-5-phosphate reductoisomerase [Robiginitomaculum sp.]